MQDISHHATLVSGDQYFNELLQQISKSRERIAITAMTIEYSEKMKPIFDELFLALKRGVKVTLVFDNFTKSPFAPGLINFANGGKTHLAKTLEICDRLRDQGASVTFVKQLKFNPFKGRYHVKVIIIDTTWYAFGGMNFCAEAFEVIDYMLCRSVKEEADSLMTIIESFQYNSFTSDYVKKFSNDTLLVDAGLENQSTIYEHAQHLAEKATEAIYVSQMQPTGPLADALKKIPTTYYFNRSDSIGFPGSVAAKIDAHHSGIKNSYKGQRLIHAKFILFRLQGGENMLISGSHNFNWRGVQYGTSEIAFISKDNRLWNDLQNFTHQKIQS
jgi:hypothetical protein